MLFGKGKKNRSVLSVSMIACAVFVALAVYGWDLPLDSVGRFLLICVGLLLLIVASAFLLIVVVGTVRKHFGEK